MAGGKTTKVMLQHAAAKRAHPNAIVFFRLGDFYEMFGDDAVLAAGLLNIQLTSRNKGDPDEIPMAGVPHHAALGYIGRLLAKGHAVAVCEQMADPKLTKGIVPREVVRVLTPGLTTHEDHLSASRNNWLAALEIRPRAVGVALFDISTAELRVATAPNLAALLSELSHEAPREVLVGTAPDLENPLEALRTVLPLANLQSDDALTEASVEEALGSVASDARHSSPEEQSALARVLRFARRCNPGVELPLRSIGRWDPALALRIDANAERHLELVASNTGDPKATLLSVVDETRTAAGARLLRRRLLAPLREVSAIRRRHDRVQIFLNHAALRDDLRRELAAVGDLERLVSRSQLGESSPRDLALLRDGLGAAAACVALLESLIDPESRDALGLALPCDVLAELQEELSRALVDTPSVQAKEGAIFLAEYDATLAELESTRLHGKELAVALETRLSSETGISNLRVRFTRVFGWYIEVSRSGLAKVPKDWRRKQTVAGGERYTLTELDELAERIASADELHRARELELLRGLVKRVNASADRIRALAVRLAEWDVDATLAEVAHRYDYCRPDVDDGNCLEISEGRHPVVERLVARGHFVPNDVALDAEASRLWIITGPNMAGKSTFLRQVALITVLAQMGSFVPAKQARIGVCDRILSRVGASDNLARGASTFMVEMKETADILRYATARSLVILDEIGRGTSTFDGLAIAWAVAEHLDQVGRCRTLFATHYHELTRFADDSPHAANYSVSARERDGDILFLHRLVQGAASRSYGVSVAKLAGLPESVLARARALLAVLEGEAPALDEPIAKGKSKRGRQSPQLGLFNAPEPPEGATPPSRSASPRDLEVLDTLRAADINELSPLQALQLIVKLKQRL